MRVYNIHDKTRTLSEKTGAPLSRRRFVKNMAIFTTLYLLPLSACKRLFHSDESRPGKYVLSNKEKEILAAVQEHLFPDDGEGPGAQKINALHHYRFVLSDKYLDDWVRKVLLSGMKWVNNTAQEFYKKDFTSLNTAEKEHVLRDLETYKNGEKWLSMVLEYIFEALLGSTAYSINPEGVGWKWLEYMPGYPQPGPNQIYGTYGYGL